ncbi:TetR/AcrR family transcriptional regulator [Herbidospora sp. RD11066]
MITPKLTAKGRATRDRIVRAAAELMLVRGVARTTIEDIQDAAKVSASQMYHYFADKDALVAAVIDQQAEQVLSVQQHGLERIDTIDSLHRWRDVMVAIMRDINCVGGCPIGSLAADLAETDPLARARVQHAFALWEGMLRDGLATLAANGEIPAHADLDRLALALLASVQGGLLLSQVRRDTGPLEAAVDTMIEHLRAL